MDLDDMAADLYQARAAEAVAAASIRAPGALLCGTCQLALTTGERVVLFLDGDLAEGGGVTDLRAREAHHYECFFAEPEGEAE